MRNKDTNCGNCFFYEGGFCKVNPPTTFAWSKPLNPNDPDPYGTSDPISTQPRVYAGDFCGKFKSFKDTTL